MDKYVLITGSSSGIGREIALMLSQNHNIILHGRNRQKLETVKSMCKESSNVLIWEYDLIDILNIEDSIKEFVKLNNIKISVFIHSAGYMKMLPLKMINHNILNETMSINLHSAIFLCKVLTNKFINGTELSSIVFISSNISNFGAKAFCMYAASKSALDALMRCLAVELAPNIRVNSVLPGGVKTSMTESVYEDLEVIERIKAQYPLGLGESSDIAHAVNFLISDKARWITGQQLTVDGGRTINITA